MEEEVIKLSRRETLIGAAAVGTLGVEVLTEDDLAVLRAAHELEEASRLHGMTGKHWPGDNGISQRILDLETRGYFEPNPAGEGHVVRWKRLTEKGRAAVGVR